MCKRTGLFATVIVAVTAFPATLGAQVPVAEVEKWIDSEIAGANGLSSLPLVRVELRTLAHSELDSNQVAALDSEVAGKGDHPKRAYLETMKRRLGEPDETLLQIVWRAPGEWRVCRTDRFLKVDLQPAPIGRPVNGVYPAGTPWTAARRGVEWYFDCCMRREHLWKLSPESLAHTTPAAGFPAGEGVEGWGKAGEALADRHLSGGVTLWREPGPRRWGAVAVNGLKWTCVIGTEGFRSRYSGRWSVVEARGFVDEVRPMGENPTVDRYALKDWRKFDLDGRGVWCARFVEALGLDGRVRTRSEVVVLEPLTDQAFEGLTRLPDASRPDPVRGELTFRVVEDFSDPRVRRTSEAGLPSVVADLGASAGGAARIRHLGWVALGALVVVLIGVRVLALRRVREGPQSR